MIYVATTFRSKYVCPSYKRPPGAENTVWEPLVYTKLTILVLTMKLVLRHVGDNWEQQVSSLELWIFWKLTLYGKVTNIWNAYLSVISNVLMKSSRTISCVTSFQTTDVSEQWCKCAGVRVTKCLLLDWCVCLHCFGIFITDWHEREATGSAKVAGVKLYLSGSHYHTVHVWSPLSRMETLLK
jgi:hypothetical protein